MSLNVTGIGETTLFKVCCQHYHIRGIDLDALAEEVLSTGSDPSQRLSNDKSDAGAEFEDTYFEHGEQTHKLIECVNAIGNSLGMQLINRIWAQVHHQYESCNLHDHLGGPELGFVFYVKVPPGSGKLYFDFGHAGVSTVEPVESMLVVFPAYLKHGVTKNLSKELRISIAGDFRRKT